MSDEGELHGCMSDLPPGAKSIMKGLKRLHGDSKYSDFIIKCGDRQWPVHKAIVCSQSSYLASAANGGFTEGIAGGISIQEQDPAVVDAAIEFMYTGLFDIENAKKAEGEPGCMLFCVLVYTLADFLNLSLLEELAITRFCAYAEDHWQAADFAEAIREVYENAPDKRDRRMRTTAVKVAGEHALLLLRNEYGHTLRSVVKEVKTFAMELQLATRELIGSGEMDHFKFRRSGCAKVFFVRSGQGRLGCPYCCSRNLDDLSTVDDFET